MGLGRAARAAPTLACSLPHSFVTTMANSELRVFLENWWRSPRQIGALVPSSVVLANAMARQIDRANGGLVLELGAGTGAITRALLKRGVDEHRLVIIERDPSFCALLRRRFPGARVLQASAERLRETLAEHGIEELDTVISSLPLLSLPFTLQRRMLRQSFSLLPAGGRFIQFTYGFGSPVRAPLQRRLGVVGRPVARILFNFPPAVVWSYSRRHPVKHGLPSAAGTRQRTRRVATQATAEPVHLPVLRSARRG